MSSMDGKLVNNTLTGSTSPASIEGLTEDSAKAIVEVINNAMTGILDFAMFTSNDESELKLRVKGNNFEDGYSFTQLSTSTFQVDASSEEQVEAQNTGPLTTIGTITYTPFLEDEE